MGTRHCVVMFIRHENTQTDVNRSGFSFTFRSDVLNPSLQRLCVANGVFFVIRKCSNGREEPFARPPGPPARGARQAFSQVLGVGRSTLRAAFQVALVCYLVFSSNLGKTKLPTAYYRPDISRQFASYLRSFQRCQSFSHYYGHFAREKK